MITWLPYVISGLICTGVWVGALGRRIPGLVICCLGHLSFIALGVTTGQHGFLVVPPVTALGTVAGIVLERRRRLEARRHTIPWDELAWRRHVKEVEKILTR